jgi:outer membrane protein TolC
VGEEEARMQIETLLADLVMAYYRIVGQQKADKVLQNTLDVSQERIRIAETKKDLGSGSEYDLLLARTDFNADRAALIRSGTILKQAKILVNELLADSSFTDYKVSSKIILGDKLNLDALMSDAFNANRDLILARLNEQIASAEIREQQGDWFPQIDVNGGYGYNRTETSAGFSDFSKTTGFSYGLTARINLFDGFNQNRNEKIGKIEVQNAKVAIEEQEQELLSMLATTYQTYLTNISLIELEGNNESIAKENLDITVEKYRIGIIPTIEFRTAQLNYITAKVRFSNAKFQAKLSEIILKQLAGNLLI